jgi:cell wall-associated NlpC family hydrolase
MFVVGLSILGGSIDDDDKANGQFSARLNANKVPEPYRKWIIRAGQTCPEIKAPLIAAQIEAESNWNPEAQSPAGAEGMSQFMPGTWKTWGVDADSDGKADPYSPADAIMTQARYDCWLAGKVKSYKLKGDQTRLTLAAYNAGPGAVEQYKGIPPYVETQDYVERIMSLIPKYSAAGDEADINGTFGERIAAHAKAELGVPYAWGGGGINGPSKGFAQGAGTTGYDCSSLVQYAVYQASNGKIVLPRTTQVQVTEGTAVSRDNIRVGDLVAWSLNGSGYDHIGVAIGDNQFVHAPKTGDVVKISELSDSYYSSRPMKIRRIAG